MSNAIPRLGRQPSQRVRRKVDVQRAGLATSNGVVLVAWAAHEDLAIARMDHDVQLLDADARV